MTVRRKLPHDYDKGHSEAGAIQKRHEEKATSWIGGLFIILTKRLLGKVGYAW